MHPQLGQAKAATANQTSFCGKPLVQLYPDAVKLGSYYYTYEKLNSGACKAPQATLQSVDAAFASAGKGTTADTTN